MKDPIFANIDLDQVGDLTVEDYLKQQCEQAIIKLKQHTDLRINHFKTESERIKNEFREIMGLTIDEEQPNSKSNKE